MAKRLVPANGRRLAALALLSALCACATMSTEPPAEAQPAGWRIVERIGEARYSPPGAAAWVSGTVGEMLADGSEVATGRGGRLIVDAPGRHISVGPDSRFVLPDPDRDDPLTQRAGWLRYRIAETEAQPFRIHTRSLELELMAGVVDVHVNHLATEVTVKKGQVRVATPDGLRQTQMMAGQSAHAAGSHEMELAVRLAPGAPLQPIDQVIVPALQPRSTPTAVPATSAPASPPSAELTTLPPSQALTASPSDRAARATQLVRAAAPAETRSHTAAASHPVGPPSGRAPAADHVTAAAVSATAPRQAVRSDAADRAAQPIEGRTTEGRTTEGRTTEGRTIESEAAAIRRSKFERLSAGMLDQVEPPPPSRGPMPGMIR